MAVDGETAESAPAEKEKIKTSGPRMSRREAYRSSKGFTVKQTPRTHFTAKGESAFFCFFLRFIHPLPTPIRHNRSFLFLHCLFLNPRALLTFLLTLSAEKRSACKPHRRR